MLILCVISFTILPYTLIAFGQVRPVNYPGTRHAIRLEIHKKSCPPKGRQEENFITGQNLFVSAYHGFVTLRDEHVPLPVPFEKFPPFAVSLGAGVKMNGALVIPARVETDGCPEASRYRLLAKIQLTAPGRCRHLGYLRNFLAEGDCSAGVVSIVIPGYAERWGYELDKYQVYVRFVLIDAVTGYRSQSQDYSTIIFAR